MREYLQSLLTKDTLFQIEQERFNMEGIEAEYKQDNRIRTDEIHEVVKAVVINEYKKKHEIIWNDNSGEEDNINNSGRG